MRWTVWLVVTACSASPASPTRPQPAPIPPPSGAPAPVAPSERECDELITHAVALGIDEQAPSRTTEADHEAVRRRLRDDFLTGCRGLPREAIRCAIAAGTLSGLAACQPTPSSSTSNSSVAPGGMTPPAPRSP